MKLLSIGLGFFTCVLMAQEKLEVSEPTFVKAEKETKGSVGSGVGGHVERGEWCVVLPGSVITVLGMHKDEILGQHTSNSPGAFPRFLRGVVNLRCPGGTVFFIKKDKLVEAGQTLPNKGKEELLSKLVGQ